MPLYEEVSFDKELSLAGVSFSEGKVAAPFGLRIFVMIFRGLVLS